MSYVVASLVLLVPVVLAWQVRRLAGRAAEDDIGHSLWRFDATGGWMLLSPAGTIPAVDFSSTG